MLPSGRIARTVFQGVLILFLALGPGGQPAAGDRAAEGDSTPSAATEVAYLLEGLPPLRRSLPLAADASPPAASAAWVWSPVCAPQRVEATGRREFPCSPATQRLEVTVQPPPSWRRDEAPPPGRIVAAPLAAWEELPEEMLPSWPLGADLKAVVPVNGQAALRLRVIGRGFGSSWVDVRADARATRIATAGTEDLAVAVVGEAGEVPAKVKAYFYEPGVPRFAYRALAFGTDRGSIVLPSAPGELRLAALFSADGFLPRRVEATVGRFPSRVPLAAGCAVEGTVVTESGEPLAEVSLHAEGRAGGGVTSSAEATTDPQGSYRFAALPKGTVAVQLQAAGRETRIERFDLAECIGRWDAAPIPLSKASALRVRVTDQNGGGVAGAHLRASGGQSIDTDPRGIAVLDGVAAARTLTLEVRAKGFLKRDATLAPPIPATAELSLARAGTVRGVLVDEDGKPVPEATVTVAVGNGTTSGESGAAGDFDVDVTPDVPLEIRASSPSTAEWRKRVDPVAAGEIREFGEVVLARGFEISGRVVAASTGEAVPGALVWAAKGPSAAALVDWAMGATARTTSAGDGKFRLSGLPFGPATFRVEAAGFAPSERSVLPAEADARRAELGDVPLAVGGTIEVQADRRLNGTARADWHGDWRESDMITVSLVAGEAVLDHVPPGESRVSVVAEGELVCDGPVSVDDGAIARFDCDDNRLQVEGSVRVGGHPVGPGSLNWHTATTSDSLILNTRTRLGLVQQQVFGAGRPQVSVDVDAAGNFATDRLSGGTWQVLWLPEGGGGTQQREVTLPAVGPVHVDLDFPGGSLQGVVHDQDGRAVAGARVVDSASGSTTRSGGDGGFRLDGLGEGVARLQALAGERKSPVVEVAVGAPEAASQPVELVLEAPTRFRLVVLDEGRPATGAVVFLEAAGRGLRLLTTDGRGEVEVDAQSASAFRAAAWVAGRWALGPWLDAASAASEGYSLEVAEVGELRVTTASAAGELEVLGPGDWPLSTPLRQMGQSLRLSPERETVLSGLPPGTYVLILGSDRQTAAIEAGREPPTVRFQGSAATGD